MKRISYLNTLPYELTDHKGARYLLDGAYKNHGEICESIVKWHLGVYTKVNPATAFDEGLDIEEYCASVKSHKCSLARSLRGDTVAEQVDDFIRRGHSTTWVWVEWDEKTERVDEFWMNETEFRAFCSLFIVNDPRGQRKVNPRFTKATGRRYWLEMQAA